MTVTSDEYVLILENGQLRDLLTMRIHGSVIEALRNVDALPDSSFLTEDAVPGLRNWAANSPNPNGQRAALARALAELIVVGGGARLEKITYPSRQPNFWEASSR